MFPKPGKQSYLGTFAPALPSSWTAFHRWPRVLFLISFRCLLSCLPIKKAVSVTAPSPYPWASRSPSSILFVFTALLPSGWLVIWFFGIGAVSPQFNLLDTSSFVCCYILRPRKTVGAQILKTEVNCFSSTVV